MDWRILVAVVVISWGGYSVLLKQAGNHLSPTISMFLFVCGYAVLVGAYCFLSPDMKMHAVFQKQGLVALVAGALCGVGGIAFFKAVPRVPGSVLFPLVGLYALVSAVGSLLIFKEPMTLKLMLGIVCATAAIMLLSG